MPETCRNVSLEKFGASDAFRNGLTGHLGADLNCVAFKLQKCGASNALQVTPLRHDVPSATHFHLPRMCRRLRVEREPEVLAANVSHNALRFSHLHRLTRIYKDFLVRAVFV